MECIEQQQAEIERLKRLNNELEARENTFVKRFYKEGIKDFAERLTFEIVNKPSEFNAVRGTLAFLNGLAHRQNEILDIVEKISKELRGESDNA